MHITLACHLKGRLWIEIINDGEFLHLIDYIPRSELSLDSNSIDIASQLDGKRVKVM